MRERIIDVHPFKFISILDIKINKEPNKHAEGFIIGHISESQSDTYVERSPVGQQIIIKASDREGFKTIFSGIVKDIDIENKNDMQTLTVKFISFSVYADISEVTRTFQYSEMTYRQVVNYLEKDGYNLTFLLPKSDNLQIGSMLVQYKETNWEFANRLASRLNTVVIPDYTLNYPSISIGIPNKIDRYTINPAEYSVCKDTDFYLKQKGFVPGLTERDALSYKFKSREIYELCTPIVFLSKEMLVYSIYTVYEGEELMHYYTLKEASGFTQKEYKNNQIIGASLTGKVKDVKRDHVQIYVDDDVAQIEYIWFYYSSSYTSADGTGWYFMPEIEDALRLHFPTEHEEQSYAISYVHVTHGNRTDPNIKFIRTIRNQEIVFAPDSILISDGNGSSIEMQKSDGITMKTDKKMSITASDDVRITSGGKVKIYGDNALYVKQNDSLIKMDKDSLDITAGHIRMQ